MSAIVVIVLIVLAVAAGIGLAAFLGYRRVLRRAKAIERGLKMVPVLIHLPPPSADTAAGNRDIREIMREKTAQAEVLYNLIGGTAQSGFKSNFYGQRHLALEIVTSGGLVHFYAAIPVAMVTVVEQAIQTAYPGAKLEEVEDHNVFSREGKLTATMGGEITTKFESAYPINTYKHLDRDPLEAMLNTFSKLTSDDGAAVQIMLRPADKSWVKHSTKLAKKKLKNASKSTDNSFTPKGIAQAVVMPEHRAEQREKPVEVSGTERTAIEAIEDKTKSIGFEVLIRVVVSTDSVTHSQAILQELANSFALFEAPGLNGFHFMAAPNPQSLVDAFIFRFFPPEVNWMILNSVELATLFHLPDAQFTPTANVQRQHSKEVDGPPTMPAKGLLLGYNEFRGKRTEVRLSDNDRRRHTYIIGQTGTGKTTMLENLLVQDMMAGNGFAFIDPHGDGAEKILGLVPKSRAEDVIYFNPSDTAYPLGLNLFEFDDPAQKDFLIQESLNMLYKIYDPNGQGTIGPRFEQWYRNAALTLMSDPNGSTFIEIPKVFTDTDYLKDKFKHLTDPTVIEFWTKEMGQTSDYHKSEMLGYFVSKFGAFQQNETMRNIMGQTKSAFNLREVMDQQKILIVNLSKGQIGELNSRLLGMIFVIKFQAAAMSRANMAEADRKDFCLYVDEFQNFSTDSFATILSEARKYRLNLIVANQFIGQLSNEIRDAVFGNVGTILSHRVGPEDAEFMTKQFAPQFDARDLVNIPNYHAVLKLLVGGLPSQPFSMSDLPMVTGSSIELANAVKQLSAAKFGQPKELVAADIAARLSSKPTTPPVSAPSATPEPTPAPEPTLAPVLSPAAAPAAAPPPPPAPPVPRVDAIQPAATTLTASTPLSSSQSQLPALTIPAALTPPSPSVAAPAPVDDHKTLSLDNISKVAGPAAKIMPDAKPTPPSQSAPAPQTPAPSTNKLADETQHEIDELLESNHLAKPERHHLSEVAPELLTGTLPQPSIGTTGSLLVQPPSIPPAASASQDALASDSPKSPPVPVPTAPILVGATAVVDSLPSPAPSLLVNSPAVSPEVKAQPVMSPESQPAPEPAKPEPTKTPPKPDQPKPVVELASVTEPPSREHAVIMPSKDFKLPGVTISPEMVEEIIPIPEPAAKSDLETPAASPVPMPSSSVAAIVPAQSDQLKSEASYAPSAPSGEAKATTMPEQTKVEDARPAEAVVAETPAKPEDTIKEMAPAESVANGPSQPAGTPELAPGEILIDDDGNVFQGAAQ